MATSTVQVCNLALARLGEDTILSLDDGTVPANLCKTHFDEARDYVLADHPWTFALRRDDKPSRLSQIPSWEWSYAYQLPADCLRVWQTDLDAFDPPLPWVVEGSTLLCNESSVKLLYIARVENPAQWTPHFVSTLSTYLAHLLAYPLTNSRAREQELMQDYQDRLEKAKEVDAQSAPGMLEATSVSTLLRVRR